MTNYLILIFCLLIQMPICIANSQIEGSKIDTIKIVLLTKDTTFYNYLHVNGRVTRFINLNDTNYISLSDHIGGGDMGTAGINTEIKFKPNIPEAVYSLYNSSKTDIINKNSKNLIFHRRICYCRNLKVDSISVENPKRIYFLADPSKFTGSCRGYYLDGNLKIEKSISDGLVIGEIKYYENGEILSKKYFDVDNKRTQIEIYFSNGQLKERRYPDLTEEYYTESKIKLRQQIIINKSDTLCEFKEWDINQKIVTHWKETKKKREYFVETPTELISRIESPFINNSILPTDQNSCDSILRTDSLALKSGFKRMPDKNKCEFWTGEGYFIFYDYFKNKKIEGHFYDNYLWNGKYYIYKNCDGELLKIAIFENGKFIRFE